MRSDSPAQAITFVKCIIAKEFDQSSAKLLSGIAVHFVSIPTLIRMKEAAGRTPDKLDIHELRILYPDDARR